MAHPTYRALRAHAFAYKRTWRGSLVSSFLAPVLYLAAMGLLLGRLVDRSGGTATLHGTYLEFLAPGLLAATAMQTAAGEATFPVMASIKWIRTYDAMLATPLRVRDVFLGHLGWMAARVTLVSSIFYLVMLAFGVGTQPHDLLLIPAGTLTGLAFAAPLAAFTATQETEFSFNAIFRFGIIPLFLFSGTFFKTTQLPGALQPVAAATPLWHGVELCRSITSGTATLLGTTAHVGYLAGLALAGVVAGLVTFDRRLRK